MDESSIEKNNVNNQHLQKILQLFYISNTEGKNPRFLITQVWQTLANADCSNSTLVWSLFFKKLSEKYVATSSLHIQFNHSVSQ